MNQKIANTIERSLQIIALAVCLAVAALMLTGCSAIKSVAQTTKEKAIAAGSDTWGGGGAGSAATVEKPTSSLDFWFGRRKVWYVSVKDKETGEAAAKVVKASNSSLDVSAGASGIEAKQ